MATDARISVGLPSHPKTKKLIRRLGVSGAWSLVCLILWVAANRSDGILAGLSDEDIELAAEWGGDDGALVRELVAVRYLDGEANARSMHNWAEHNPWAAGADMRSAKARWNSVKRYHGAAEADRQVPEYATIRSATAANESAASTAISTKVLDECDASSTRVLDDSNAPSPSPYPYPYPSPSPYPYPTPTLGGESVRAEPAPTGLAVASPPPPIPEEFLKTVNARRPELDPQSVWAVFCEHYPAAKRGAARWRKWVEGERGATVPGPAATGGVVADPDARCNVEAVGLSLGLGRWDEVSEQWASYKKRVRTAALEGEKCT